MALPSARILPATLQFLEDLEAHNDRDWFQANKARYQAAHANMVDFADALLLRLRVHDRIATANGRDSLMRIYADQRFHKDRPPYAPRFGGRFARVKPALRGGYFFRLQPGGRSYITCGFMGPDPGDMKRIRADIAYDHGTWERLLKGKKLRAHFPGLEGEVLKSAPRGFAKDHPAIGLLRHVQFLLRHPVTDREVLAPRFVDEVDAMYRSVRPFFDHMSEVLTSDGDGTSLLKRGR